MEMCDDSVAALPAVFSTPVEVERAVVEQEGQTRAASMEVDGSPPASFTHEKTQTAPERTEPSRMETVSAAGRGAAGDAVEDEAGGVVDDSEESLLELLTPLRGTTFGWGLPARSRRARG